jgi:serine/threonine protein phosphatase 1
MIYVVSDIHGCYDQYIALLQKIDLTSQDVLYVLGDVLDRGPAPIKVLQDMMKRSNVFTILGNHDFVAAVCLKELSKQITEESLDSLDKNILGVISDWLSDGGAATLKEFRSLPLEDRADVMDYLGEFSLSEEINVAGKTYILAHAGLGNFTPDKSLGDYSLEELAFGRTDYTKQLFDDKYLITGHTPTRLIPGNSKPDYIYRINNHIAIDCGCVFGGRLGAICLDTGEEFYVE